ncbi:hypothetical protein [Anaeroselena agilis]|uniref:Uncharacterized protein n=1 Tax=Anaeroselena agilis TaxID=3063788 RepID=A0ABU3P366_9FIRM|nr:hypothetical protein [Selenomonadales bacterium 4137-cl]
MRFLRILCVAAVVLSLSGQANASPFGLSGEWKLNANGWTYKMVLLEKGDQLEGVLHPLNQQSSDTQMTGKISPDGRIEFSVDLAGVSQSYTGYIFQGGTKNTAMAGLLSLPGNQQLGWFAERPVQGAQPAVTPAPYYPPQPAYPTTSINVFSAASLPMSGNEKARRFEVDTIFDKVPCYITPGFRGEVVVQPGQKLLLAGNAEGTADWRVSGFLFIEFQSGYSVRRLVVGGGNDRIKYEGRFVEKVGPRGVYHSPGSIDFAPYLPQNTTVYVKIYALHYGPGVGSVSNVYLLTK